MRLSTGEFATLTFWHDRFKWHVDCHDKFDESDKNWQITRTTFSRRISPVFDISVVLAPATLSMPMHYNTNLLQMPNMFLWIIHATRIPVEGDKPNTFETTRGWQSTCRGKFIGLIFCAKFDKQKPSTYPCNCPSLTNGTLINRI